MKREAVEEILSKWFEAFNDLYIKQGIPIKDRPLMATFAVIDNAIEDTNIPEDKIKEPPFIGYFHEFSYNWFSDKYGEAVIPDLNENIISYVLIENIPFKIIIPRVLKEKSDKEFHKVIIWPEEIFDYEKPLDWIQKDINISKFDEKDDIYEQIKMKAFLLRKIAVKRMLISDNTQQLQNILTDISRHLENFVDGFIADYNIGISNPLWELHLAIEKSMKAILKYKKKNFKKSHDLKYLDNLLAMNINKDIIDIFPSFDVIAKYRYSENVEKDILKIERYYVSALKYISELFINTKTKINSTGSPRIEIIKFLDKNYRKEEFRI